MFNHSRQLGASASLPVPISAPLSPPDEHDAQGSAHGDQAAWHPTKRGHARASSSISGALGMHMGPPSGTGYGGLHGSMDPPRTVERRRKGRMVDVITALPTPPRTKDTRLDPTPPHKSSLSISHRSLAPVPSTEMVTSDPTFAYSSSWQPTSGGRHDGEPIKLTRRPGLTFAQQMAAAASNSSSGSSDGFVGRIHGVGVGMGGTRLSSQHGLPGKVDDLFSTLSGRVRDQGLLGPAPIADEEGGNPFLVPAAKVSPAADVNMEVTPATPTTATSSLFTPPPAPTASTIAPLQQPPAFVAPPAPSKREWAAPVVGDEDDNPFYVKPGTAMGPPPPPMEDMHEKPTVEYVFRGTKTKFANPHYRMPAGDTLQSRLPMSHPDFSPAPAPKPRLLWPAREASPTPGADDDVDMDEDTRPQKLFFSARSGIKHSREEDEAEDLAAKRPRVLRL